VYAWGPNSCSELGLGHRKIISNPTLIPFFKGAMDPNQLLIQKKEITDLKTAAFNSLWQYGMLPILVGNRA